MEGGLINEMLSFLSQNSLPLGPFLLSGHEAWLDLPTFLATFSLSLLCLLVFVRLFFTAFFGTLGFLTLPKAFLPDMRSSSND